jgi:RNA polymerase sigma factor
MLNSMEKEEIIEYLRSNPSEEKKCRDFLIESNFSFIVYSISQVTGKYVELENSEELSIGLLAFNEAITKYDSRKGASFLSFGKLVISSRVKDFIKKESSKNNTLSLDYISEKSADNSLLREENLSNDISLEIEEWETTINKFGFTLEELADESPKHIDTRKNAINLSEKISDDKEMVSHIYIKFRLPVTKIVIKFKTTSKVVKRSKKFIVATFVILTKRLNLLKDWIYQGEKGGTSC